jgi:hypothetical protein
MQSLVPVLSLDFDFWVPVRPEYRPPYAERGGDYDLEVWQRRVSRAKQAGIDLRQHINLSKDDRPTPDELANWLAARKVTLASNGIALMDRHHYAFAHFVNLEYLWLVHVDAHHDLGYHNSYSRTLNCGTWVGHLVEKGVVKKLTVIYPHWTATRRFGVEDETPHAVRTHPVVQHHGLEVEALLGLEQMPSSIHFVRTAISRSGGWTPPWLDRHFTEFTASMCGSSPAIYEPTPVRQFNYDECRVDAREHRRGSQMDASVPGRSREAWSSACESVLKTE